MSYLVTFTDGHATLFTERVAAEQAASYWPHAKPTIRDLDQEARDREEMIWLLESIYKVGYDELWQVHDDTEALLKRLGRLP